MAQNKVNNVLIVGGSSGVGLAVGKLALSQLPGARIILSSTNETRLKEAVEEVRKEATSNENLFVDYVVGDVSNFDTQFDDVEAVLRAAVDKFGGKINHVVWTAGRRPSGNSTERNNSDIIEMMSSRLSGPMTLTTFAKQYMDDSRHSSITLTSGIRIYRPTPGRGRLSGAGGGLDGAARGMAVDIAPIRANVVNLGAIQTPLLEQAVAGNEAVRQYMMENSLLKTLGTAAEAAEAYLYSMRCGYVTGSRIDVEGGSMLC